MNILKAIHELQDTRSISTEYGVNTLRFRRHGKLYADMA